jgi:hypothetical protein
MSKRLWQGGASLDAAIEIERFASFDHPTRRFIAYAMTFVPHLLDYIGNPPAVGGNPPAPFAVSAEEQAERAAAYAAIPKLRDCRAKGAEGQRLRRQHFGDLLAMAKVDLRWKRLTGRPALIFCYERLVGAEWRELLIPLWKESALQRRKRGPVQLPLDRRLRDDASVPNLLEDDTPPMFYPSMADADAIGAPLLAGL